MRRHGRAGRATVATALGAAMAMSIFLPASAAGDPVGDLLGGLGVGGNAGGGASVTNGAPATGSAQDRAGSPPNYRPPLHGTNPHGEGTVATVDILPSNNNPYPGNPAAGDEEIVVGDSRGEQNGGSYHGRVTLAYVALPIPGFPVVNVFIETNPGETKQGPTAPLNAGALANLCTASMGATCIAVLPMDSSTGTTASYNSFALFRGSFLQGQTTINLGTSSGSVQETGGCQAATGTSSIANGNVTPLGGFDVFSASSASTACNSGSQSTQNSSSFINLFGLTPPVPPALAGCANLMPNSSFVGPGGLLGLVCHGDEVNGGQTTSPYGIREAFTRSSGSSATRHCSSWPCPARRAMRWLRRRPRRPRAPPRRARWHEGQGEEGRRRRGRRRGRRSRRGGGTAGGGQLAFTGHNLLLLVAIGAGLLAMGLVTARRSRSLA